MALHADDRLNRADEAQKALLSKEHAEMQPAVEKLNAVIDSPKPAIPDLKQVPEAPANNFGKDSQEWMTAMAVLSGVTGAFSRQHATAALGAFAAGMKGFQDGNKQAADAAHKQWKDSSDAAIENNKILRDKYEEVLKDRDITEQEQLNKIHLIAAQYHDELTFNAKDIAMVAKLVESQEKAAASAEKQTAAMDMFAQKQKMEWDQWTHKQEYMQNEKKSPSIDQATADFAADQLLAGDKSGLSNYGRGEKATANLSLIHETVQKRAAERGVTGDQLAHINAQFAGDISEARAVGTASGKIKLAANSLDESLPLLEDAMKRVDLGQFTDLNTLENYARSHSGDTNIVTLNTALQTTVTDYSSLIARNGQRTDATDAAAKHLANTSMANGQLQAFIDQVKKEKKAQLKAVSETKSGESEEESKIPENAPTATDTNGNKVHWNGKEWVK